MICHMMHIFLCLLGELDGRGDRDRPEAAARSLGGRPAGEAGRVYPSCHHCPSTGHCWLAIGGGVEATRVGFWAVGLSIRPASYELALWGVL